MHKIRQFNLFRDPIRQEAGKPRRLRFYAPEEREELETELYNVEQAAKYGEELKAVYDKICMLLCQMKEIRGTLRRIKNGDTPDHVELFELKNYLQRMETLIPLVQQVDEKAQFKNLAFHDPAVALAVLDPENTRSRGFYIPDSATQKLREIRQAKKQIDQLTALGFDKLPICVAKTQYSFSDDPTKLGAPEDFTVTIKNVKVSAGAGFLVVLTGDIMTMPGLPKVPAAEKIDIDNTGKIEGLF